MDKIEELDFEKLELDVAVALMSRGYDLNALIGHPHEDPYYIED